MKKLTILIFTIILSVLTLSSCSKAPDKKDLTIILKDELQKKAFVSSDIFKKFPVSVKDSIFSIKKNKKMFDALIKMGIMEKNDTIYYLSKAGKRLHDEKTSSMFFVGSYEILEIKDVQTTDNGWAMTLLIAPKELQAWINDPAIIEDLKPVKVSDYIDPQEQKIEIVRAVNKKDPADKRFYKLIIKNKLNQSFTF
ncbi:hypothetical protein [Apibacter sp. HY039]|uniref:hypothetical protein n=1 Tax=Apibacter sp. HY039 TaxID=2501476 RepID=UPI000FEC1CD4|nr:hypothetical protein [Apibacter sp. HY039]